MALVAIGSPLALVSSRPASPVEPVLATAIHHWSTTAWTTAAGNVVQVDDQIGTAHLLPILTVTEDAIGLKPAWKNTAATSLLRSSAVGPTVYNEGTCILVVEPVNTDGLAGWGNGNGLLATGTGAVTIQLALFMQDTTGPGAIAAGVGVVVACSWRTDGGGANGRLRIATSDGGILESYDGTGISTPNATDHFDSGGVEGKSVGGNRISAQTFGATYSDDATLLAACAAYAAYWL